MTSIEGSVALVTGGSRGIGRALVAALYERWLTPAAAGRPGR
jgi:NAD(P)-dependent dehydrogenase (short-subunit alcohol dehydrogenase family)